MLVEACDLGKRHGTGASTAWALRSVTFAVGRGEWVAVRGPSGSGKSTLLQIVGGLDRPTRGEVKVDGRSLQALSDDELARYRRRDVGFVFQSFNLLPSLTVLENVLLPLWIDGGSAHGERARGEALLERMGIVEKRAAYPDELSGGEQQRVAFARALIAEPKILLADEPTGSLDSVTGRKIMEGLRRTAESLSQTILLVTHDEAVAAFADRSLHLEDGALLPPPRRVDTSDRNVHSPSID